MKLYGGLNSIPELQGLPKAQQRQIWRQSLRAAFHKPQVWGSYGGAMIMIGIVIVFQQNGLAEVLGGAGREIVVSMLIGGLSTFIAMQFIIRATRPFMAIRRAALEAPPPADGSYHVPPAF